MKKNLTCQQVMALINFYIEGKLNPKLSDCISKHIENCPSCKKKLDELSKIYNKFKEIAPAQNFPKEQARMNSVFIKNLSAYIDNELSLSDNIKIKKIAISNPNARKELESMYRFKTILKQAYEKTKSDFKNDFSKNIISKINATSEYSTSYFYKIGIVFIGLVISILCCFFYLYF